MKFLLDTCTFLWIIHGDSELSNNVLNLYLNPENEIYFSSISFWEMMVKHQLGKLPLPAPAEEFVTEQRKLHRIESLSLQEEAVMQLSRLPQLHKDPFDRMIICQAIAHNLTILTPDHAIKQYPVACVW